MKLLHSLLASLSDLLPDTSIEKSKKQWNKLADENGKYYIVSKEGKQITDEKFSELGRENYTDLVLNDDALKAALGNFVDKTAIDIGCGIGRITEHLAADFKTVYGFDISEKMIQAAKTRLVHLSNVTFIATDGMHYPLEDGSVDFVFSYIVFQHMPSVAVVKENFKEVRRVLKNTGIAKIQVRGGHKVVKRSWYYGPTFKSGDMKKMMDEVGLEIVKEGDDSVKRYFLWLKKKQRAS
jgi:SAM-dependent methyltransferase